MFIYIHIYLSIYLSIYPSIHPSIHLYVYVNVHVHVCGHLYMHMYMLKINNINNHPPSSGRALCPGGAVAASARARRLWSKPTRVKLTRGAAAPAPGR